MNLFNDNFMPMLLSKQEKPFNDSHYLFEIKLDGIRALMFGSPKKIIIRNRKKQDITRRYPELSNIKSIFKNKVIFDGEIVLFVNGLPSFEKLKKRILLENINKILKYSKELPIVFVAFDILYEGKDLTTLPLIERKKILEKYPDTDYFIKSEYILGKGKQLFEFVKKHNIEGIVAKRIDSTYQINKRSDDWIKIKNIDDDDFIILGYNEEENNAMASLLFGKKIKNKLTLIGTVTIGKKKPDYQVILNHPKDNNPSITKEGYIPIIPTLECTIEFIEKTEHGRLRQPKFKSLK
ncbi:MAG: hypothetical protein GX265_04395 [Mollicutes bacterium]|nr:hypothetical protein [Mollicutes bacterium]